MANETKQIDLFKLKQAWKIPLKLGLLDLCYGMRQLMHLARIYPLAIVLLGIKFFDSDLTHLIYASW